MLSPALHIAFRKRIGGFTYLGVIILLVIMMIASTAAIQIESILQKRATEEELLNIGAEFQDALSRYAKATPKGAPTEPQSLNDLLKDPRYPGTQRYLRKLYLDPMTGTNEWGIVKSPDGKGIAGVFSLSPSHPLKIGNFPDRFKDFDGKAAYQEWKFMPSIATQALAKPQALPTPQPNRNFFGKPATK